MPPGRWGPWGMLGQLLELDVEVGMVEKETLYSAFEDYDLELLVALDRAHDLSELQNKLRPHQVQRRVVQ